MDGPRWIVEEIAGASGSPVKHRLDASVQRSSPQSVGIARLPKTDAEFGTRIGRKDQPAFILSARKARLPRRFVVGMNLDRSEEHTSELQSLMRTSYAVFCLKKKK